MPLPPPLPCWFADGRSDAIEFRSSPPARRASQSPPGRSSRRNRARLPAMRLESPRLAASCWRAPDESRRGRGRRGRQAPGCPLARSPAAVQFHCQSTFAQPWLSGLHAPSRERRDDPLCRQAHHVVARSFDVGNKSAANALDSVSPGLVEWFFGGDVIVDFGLAQFTKGDLALD